MFSLLIVLKWFLNVCNRWKWLLFLFLKYSIVFIMCFSMCGLVMLFFLVIWLIRNMVVLVFLVKCISCVVFLCIWLIEFGVVVRFFVYRVCIELVMISRGFVLEVCCRIDLMLVLVSVLILFSGSFRWCVWLVICVSDFLLVMQSIGSLVVIFVIVCSSSVDLLMFGLLFISIIVFLIRLLFSMWLNLLMLVVICWCLVCFMFFSVVIFGGLILLVQFVCCEVGVLVVVVFFSMIFDSEFQVLYLVYWFCYLLNLVLYLLQMQVVWVLVIG